MERNSSFDERKNSRVSIYTYKISPEEYNRLKSYLEEISSRLSNNASSGGLGVVLNSLMPYPPNSDNPEYYEFKSSSPNTQLEDFFSE